ncbi:MAG: SRPBCC domain-containing protein, partial [Leptospirales bacterium]
MEKTKIKIEATIAADRGKTWEHWTAPEHITNWNFASDDWRCPRATNDLRVGGKYFARMEAKDGSFGFDFEATYDEVAEPSQLAFTMPDGRRAITQFEDLDGKTKVTTVFDAESENPVELQKDGWQAILNNFKKYVEIENSQGFVHETISIRRAFEAPVERVFAAWARPEVRVIWGPPSADEA